MEENKNIFLPYNAETVVLSIYPNKSNTYVHVKTCSWVFIAVLLLPKLGNIQDVLQ